MMDYSYEMTKHCFSDLKIRDHAVFHWANSRNVTRGPPKHHFGFLAHCQNFVDSPAVFSDSHDRRLTQHNPFAFHINEGVSCPEIDG